MGLRSRGVDPMGSRGADGLEVTWCGTADPMGSRDAGEAAAPAALVTYHVTPSGASHHVMSRRGGCSGCARRSAATRCTHDESKCFKTSHMSYASSRRPAPRSRSTALHRSRRPRLPLHFAVERERARRGSPRCPSFVLGLCPHLLTTHCTVRLGNPPCRYYNCMRVANLQYNCIQGS